MLYLQALIDRRQGRVEGAIRNLERVTELSPNEVTAAYDLAECYSVLRRAKPFFRVMDRLVLQNPRDPERIPRDQRQPGDVGRSSAAPGSPQ